MLMEPGRGVAPVKTRLKSDRAGNEATFFNKGAISSPPGTLGVGGSEMGRGEACCLPHREAMQ